MKSKKNFTYGCLLYISMLIILLLFSLPCYASTSTEQTEYIQIPRQQYQQLISNSQALEARFILLSEKISLLEMPLSEQTKQLIELSNELNEAKNLLATANSNLQKSNESLTNARLLLARTETSLNQLEQQIDQIHKEYRAKIRRHKWQKVIAYTIAGGLAYAYVTK